MPRAVAAIVIVFATVIALGGGSAGAADAPRFPCDDGQGPAVCRFDAVFTTEISIDDPERGYSTTGRVTATFKNMRVVYSVVPEPRHGPPQYVSAASRPFVGSPGTVTAVVSGRGHHNGCEWSRTYRFRARFSMGATLFTGSRKGGLGAGWTDDRWFPGNSPVCGLDDPVLMIDSYHLKLPIRAKGVNGSFKAFLGSADVDLGLGRNPAAPFRIDRLLNGRSFVVAGEGRTVLTCSNCTPRVRFRLDVRAHPKNTPPSPRPKRR
jgi:hypothetical protein